MYERSAIVLERYIEKILKFDNQYNLRSNYNNFKGLMEELENYQIISTKEAKIIQEFDEAVKKIEEIQKEQEKIYNSNIKLEGDRNKLFSDLDESPETLEKKFNKLETLIAENDNKLKELKSQYIIYVSDFIEKQKERNKCEKERRVSETTYIEHVKECTDVYNAIDTKDILFLKQVINTEKEEQEKEISSIMVKNGKNEKVAFNQDALKMAIDTRLDIAEREANCYISMYDKMKKLLTELDSDNIKLNKYKKALKDVSIKLDFLNAEKEYIVSFLDYERMTAISGEKIHCKMMQEACKNFESDIKQINNLYDLILREIVGKTTKKAYKELYNKSYLKNIEDKEKNFEQEVTNIKLNMGTVINSNYWRIDGIKNIYEVFQKDITEKFERDLSEFNEEEINEPEIQKEITEESNKKQKQRLTFSDEEDDESDDEDFEDEIEDLDEDDYEEDEENYNEEDEITEPDDNDEEDDDDIDDESFEDDDDSFDDDDFIDSDDEDDVEDDDDELNDDFIEDDEMDDEMDVEEDDDEIGEDFFANDKDENDFEDEDEDEEDDKLEDWLEAETYNKKKNKNTDKRNVAKKVEKKIEKEVKLPKRKLKEKKYVEEPIKSKNNAKANKGIFDKIFKDKKNKVKK